MRNTLVLVIISLVFILYGTINYYIGIRGWQSLGRFVPFLNSKLYWLVFWAVALSYLAARLGENYLPTGLHRAVTNIGAYWLAAMFYFLLILLIIDLVRLLDRWFHLIPAAVKAHPGAAGIAGLAVLGLVAAIVVYGAWNARHPRVTHYDISIAKKAGDLKELHVVAVSDVHLGTLIHNGRLTRMVDMINGLQPDIVLMPGDVIDEDVEAKAGVEMAANFRRIESRLGVYSVPGNHEYIGGRFSDVLRYLENAGVTVLRDRSVKIADSFYVVGRDDLSGRRFGGQPRKELPDLLDGIDRSLPLILLDHQPVNLAASAKAGIDLQLSGHTHQGQLFPINFITGRMYETDWGHLKKGNFQLIVSTGYGTWGPPIRTGNRPEIVDIVIRFK